MYITDNQSTFYWSYMMWMSVTLVVDKDFLMYMLELGSISTLVWYLDAPIFALDGLLYSWYE